MSFKRDVVAEMTPREDKFYAKAEACMFQKLHKGE